MTLAPGSRIGPYEITEQIGIGGMGEVYRASDLNLGRDVAIKVLPEAFAQDADRLARFEREAKTLASLSHPNIAIVHGFEKAGEIRALVMELVEGPTLADLIGGSKDPPLRRSLSIDEAMAIARQIAEALEAAHEQGIVHRDLKPANVKVRDDGTVKVLDFGLAKMIGPPDGGPYIPDVGVGLSRPTASMSPTITTPAMTQLGVILGTAAYMAPEQARGKPVDKRSDIWAFGCVLFEMLTGMRAFDGEDATDTIAAVVRAEPKWDVLPAGVPNHIRLLLRRCLEKDRKRRIGDISTALFIMSEPASADANVVDAAALVDRKRSRWLRTVPLLATAAVTAALVGGAAWALRPSPPPAAIVSRFSFPLPEGQQFTNAGRPIITVSPDGTRIAYVANRRLYLRSISETRPREIQGSEDSDGITTPSFSPDGQQVVFVSVADRALKRISANGGVPFTICPLPQSSFGTSWGPDGILFGQRPGNIFRVSPNGGTPQLLFKAPDGELAYGPQMLPGGDAMLLTLGRTANTAANPDLIENPRVDLYSLTSGERTTLIDRGADARYVPTGHIVYADGAALVAVGFDLKRRQVIGDSVPVVEGVRRGVASPAAQFGVSTTGMLAYVPGSALTGRALAFLDRRGGSEVLKLANGTYSTPRLSPDGKQLAVEISDSRSINIWIYDVAGRASIRQLTLEGQSRYPLWSADGERVTFASNRQGEDAIWWQRADGSGVAERLTQPMKGIEHAPTSWHPREPTLLYLARQGATESALWTYSLTDKRAKPFPGLEGQQVVSAQFSPDGRWIAYQTTQPGPRAARLAMFVQPYPSTGAVYPVAASGSQPLWSPDGSELFFARASTLFATRITTQAGFATSVAEEMRTSFWIPTQWRNFDITPDGKRFLAVVPAPGSEAGEFATGQIDVVLNWFDELKRLVPTQ